MEQWTKRRSVLRTQRNALRAWRNPSLTLRVEKHLAGARCGEEEQEKRQRSEKTILGQGSGVPCVSAVKISRGESPGEREDRAELTLGPAPF
jgi:hypothetical protein